MSQFFMHADCSAHLFGVGSCVRRQGTRGPFVMGGAMSHAEHRLPTDSIGSAVVSFVGAIAGSEIRVYFPNTTEAAGVENCVADQVLSWSAFPQGSPNNTVRVLVMNNGYRLKEFTYTASVGNQSLPIQMEPDRWFNNP